jgi:hypothetical protein
MCLIGYSPKGAMIDRSILAHAYNQNPDGIGIMSKIGIEKFMGKKALKRARRYLEAYVVPEKVAYAIHFRWATHGAVQLSNTHPYITPQNTHAVMHNGVISITTAESSKEESDTAVFVRKYMDNVAPYDDATYYKGIEKLIGWGSKLCIMNDEGAFKLCNEEAGVWIEGIWFSNTYSLPSSVIPRSQFADTFYYKGGSRTSGYGTYINTYQKTIWDTELNRFVENPDYIPYIPKQIWDKELGTMVDNPEYKAADNQQAVVTHYMGMNKDFPNKEAPVNLLEWRAKQAAKREVWSNEDRTSYYQSLEDKLTASQEADYYDVGTAAAKAAEAELERSLEEDMSKDVAPLGGDIQATDDEEQSQWRKYLSQVASGVFNS